MYHAEGRHPFVERFESLLENSSEVLGVHLEVWVEPQAPALSLRPTELCLHCATATPALFSACQERRWREGQRSAELAAPESFQCERGLRVDLYPIAHGEPPTTFLVSVEESPQWPGGGPGGPDPLSPVDRAVYGQLSPEFLVGRPIEPADDRADRIALPGDRSGTASPLSPRRRAFLADLCRLISDQMCMYQEYNSLNHELSARYDELHTLYALSGRLTSQEDMRQGLRRMMEQTRAAVDADAVVLVFGSQRLNEVVTRPDWEQPAGANHRFWRKVGLSLEARLSQQRSGPVMGSLAAGEENLFPDGAAFVASQLGAAERTDGVLALLRVQRGAAFRLSDLKLIGTLAERVAVAIQNAELYEDLQDFLMATVKSLVSAIEAKDSYTSGHSERVNLISMLLGKAMGLSPEELETLRWASILHDVGKIGMPECILNKPSALNPEEQRIMREHPERGYTVLDPIRQLRVPAVSVRAHHESFDGRGYPYGISGAEIPLVARIISVADAYDAITTTRPYSTRRSFEAAVHEIRKVRGTQLDPAVVDVFLSITPFLEEHYIMIHASAESLRDDAAA